MQLYTRLRIDGIKVISRGILGGKQVIKFANTRSRGRVCLFYQNDLIFMQKVQSPEKARRLFMKFSVYDIVYGLYVAHAWAEFVAGLLFSPVSFCNSADPPWIPGFCRLCASTHLLALAAGFVFENKGIVSVVFLIFCRRLINITRQLSYGDGILKHYRIR